MIHNNNFIEKNHIERLMIVVLFVISTLSCSSDCENVILKSIASPNEEYNAIAFSRSCGATTGNNLQVSIVKNNKKLPNKPGNIFICDKSEIINIFWENTTTLVVQYDQAQSRVFKEIETFKDISILYQDISSGVLK